MGEPICVAGHDYVHVILGARAFLLGRTEVAILYCRRCGKNGAVGAIGKSVEFEPWAEPAKEQA